MFVCVSLVCCTDFSAIYSTSNGPLTRKILSSVLMYINCGVSHCELRHRHTQQSTHWAPFINYTVSLCLLLSLTLSLVSLALCYIHSYIIHEHRFFFVVCSFVFRIIHILHGQTPFIQLRRLVMVFLVVFIIACMSIAMMKWSINVTYVNSLWSILHYTGNP